MPLRRDGVALSFAARRPRRGAIPLAEATQAYASVSCLSPSFLELTGALPTSGCSMLVSGPPGTGKSTVAAAQCSFAARAGKTVLYVAAENAGKGPALHSIMRRAGATAHGREILISDAERPREVLDDLLRHRPFLAVIDSWQAVDAVLEDLPRWAAASSLLVLLSHVNTDGGVRGGPELEHAVDVVLWTSRQGVQTRKSRFGSAPGTTLAFEDLLFHPEIEAPVQAIHRLTAQEVAHA